MDVSGLGFSLQGPLKHLLGRHVLAAIEFNYPAVVQRVCVARKHILGPETGLCDRQVSAGSGRYF